MKKLIAIIGGGPAAMLLAAQLDEHKFDVTIYEQNSALGRKFLVAGEGGFNLTHSEPVEKIISRYTPVSFFEKIIQSFTNVDLRNWFSSIGIETTIGSSKRVFPVDGVKPIDVLNAVLKVLKQKNVSIKTKHLWKGWTVDKKLLFETNGLLIFIKADIVVFALGGASWKVTGSNKLWVSYFKDMGVDIIPFQASNCAFEIKWTKEFIAIAEGKSLKNIIVKCDYKENKGELVITKFGLEGGAVYALSPLIGKHLNESKIANVYLDLKPSFTVDEIKKKIDNRGNK